MLGNRGIPLVVIACVLFTLQYLPSILVNGETTPVYTIRSFQETSKQSNHVDNISLFVKNT